MKTIPMYSQEIEKFSKYTSAKFSSACIILYGSLANDTYQPHSDVDIIVISDELPENYLQRLVELNRFRDGKTPFEIIGYTTREWEKMMATHHLTVLEALHWGIPLTGEALFELWKSQLEGWKKLGLRRGKSSWVIPPAFRNPESSKAR